MPGDRRSECRRATASALVGALVATLLLPAATLGVEPTDDPSPVPSGAVVATDAPETSSPSPAPDEPTREPSKAPIESAGPSPTAGTDPSPSASAEPTETSSLEPTESAGPTPTDEPTPGPTATPGPTDSLGQASPSAPPTVAPLADGDVVLLTGYRYTTAETSVHEDADDRSTVVTTLDPNTRVTVTQAVEHGGETWVAVSAPTEGHVDADALSTTSAPTPISVTRFAKQWTSVLTRIGGVRVKTVPAGTYVKASAEAYDQHGQKWIDVSFVYSGVTYRGWMPWSHTTTTPVSVSGVWTLIRDTTLYRYPYLAAPKLKSLANGAQVSRHVKVIDTSNVGWTKVLVSGTTWGWVLTAYLTPPYKQFIWNRRNPVTQQYTNYWCVPASVQTELNIGLNGYSTSRSFQQAVYTYGRAHMGYRVSGVGLDPQSWHLSLEAFDTKFGSRNVYYQDDTFSTYTTAIKWGAIQMRKTGLPVGLLVYYGGHAWTMIGFTATADPLKTMAFKVTGVYVAAPFQAWTDPPPGTYYTFAQFGKKMTPYYEQSAWTRWNGRYTIVLPSSG